MQHELITVREAAAMLGVYPRTINRYREAGLLPFYQYSRRKYLYNRIELEQFQQRCYRDTSDVQLSFF